MGSNFLIYMHTAPNGKSYIGQTKNLHRRNIVHKNTDGCRAFANAIKKYGWDNFKHEILAESLTLDEANRLEPELIERHGTLSPSGYNLRTGGDSPGFSEETRAKLSAIAKTRKVSEQTRFKLIEAGKNQSREHRDRFFAAARNKSPEIRAKISAANKGRIRTPEARARMSVASKNRSAETREKLRLLRIGKQWSAVTKEKMAASAKARWERKRNEKRLLSEPSSTNHPD